MLPFHPGSVRHKLFTHSLPLLTWMVSYFTVAYLLMEQTGIGCIYLYYLGIPCPGCGMTRALVCVLQCDFVAAFQFHPLIFAMPYVFTYILFPLKGRFHKHLLSCIGILAIIHWVYRIICVAI